MERIPDSRYATLQDMDEAGVDLRLWCYACARGARIDTIIWEEFVRESRSIALADVQRRARCRACRSGRDVLLLPATRPELPPTTGARIWEAFFHRQRALAKRRAK